jgi:hypothetical protein
MIEEGQQIFRFDTFGDEAFWGDTLKLHQATEGARFGGVGPGVSPAIALAVGLKVDAEALPAETLNAIGIDDFQSSRSPDHRYRTTTLAGLFTRQKGGFYHDGRFPDLGAVIEHYNQVFNLNLSEQAKKDLVEYLKSL